MKWFIVYYVLVAGQPMTFVDTTPFTTWERCQSEISNNPLKTGNARAVCAGNDVVLDNVMAKAAELAR